MIVGGNYCGLPFLSASYSMRAGTTNSRGYVRVLLSDLGGKLPDGPDLHELEKHFLRNPRKNILIKKSFAPTKVSKGSTVTEIRSSPAPEANKNLTNYAGTLSFKTTESDGPDASGTEVTIKGIYWLEATIEQMGHDKLEGIVRIELTDERILWDLGGMVYGRRNWILNETKDSAVGQIFQWTPVLGPGGGATGGQLKDIASAQEKAEECRPIMDPDSLLDRKQPYTVFQLLLECCSNLPGPPNIQFSHKVAAIQITPMNVDWKQGTLAKAALEDLIRTNGLVLVPRYTGGFKIYTIDEKADDDGITDAFEEIGQEYHYESNIKDSAVSVALKPMSFEVIGSRSLMEVCCPDFEMVVKDDGTLPTSRANGRIGEWMPAKDYLQEVGYNMPIAGRSLAANYDKHDSAVYKEVAGETDEIKQRRRSNLRQHLFKSFMISPTGPFRKFLPMIMKRAGGMTHALNFKNFAMPRDAQIFCDGWSPTTIREALIGAFFVNCPLQAVDKEDVAHVDEKAGVITLKVPRGMVALETKYDFGSGDNKLMETLYKVFDVWGSAVTELGGKLQEMFDKKLYALGRGEQDSLNKPNDVWHDLRTMIKDFIKEQVKLDYPEVKKQELEETSNRIMSGNFQSMLKEQLPLLMNGGTEVGGNTMFNLSEFRMVPPKMVVNYTWEMNTGRTDDYYRFFGGKVPSAPSFPIYVKELVQYNDLSGGTNKEALDILAEIKIKEYDRQNEKSVKGGLWKFYGFHEVDLSGEVTDVDFHADHGTPDATTTVSKNRTASGIVGLGKAIATWSAFQKPVQVIK